MKYFLSFLMLMIVISCGDDKGSAPVVTPPIDTYVADTIWQPQIGDIFKYRAQDGQEAQLEILADGEFEWCLDFWDTTKLASYYTYICKFTEYEGTFPKVTMFGAAVQDTNILWGKRDVDIINKWDRLPYYVSLFKLNSELTDTTISREYNYKIANVEFRCADSVIYSLVDMFFINDSLYSKQYMIQSVKKNNYTDIAQEGDDFIFVEKFGFTRVWKYVIYDLVRE